MRRLFWWWRRRDEELREELQGHLRMAIRDRLARGESPEEAADAARREFGNVDLVAEVTRDMWDWRWLDLFGRDIRHALRTMRRSPGYTAVIVLTLALGIGANTAIFTIVNAVLLERLPFADANKLVVVWEDTVRRPGRSNVVGPANYLRWRERATSFQQMAAAYDTRTSLSGSGEPEDVVVQVVTPEFFTVLGLTPAVGRVFAAADAGSDTATAAVLSYQLWQRRFGGRPEILGQAINLGGRLVTVIGVMPPDARLFLEAGTLVGKRPDLWMPLHFPEEMRKPRGRFLVCVARLRPGVSIDRARAEMKTISNGLTAEWPEFDTGWTVKLVPLRSEISGDSRPGLLLLAAAVALVLLIACANVANLLLARGAARQREFRIRAALGAGRGQLVRQVLTEMLVLALAGAVVGLVAARWVAAFLVSISPVEVPGLDHVGLNPSVLGFTAAVAFATVLLCGFAPAVEVWRASVRGAADPGTRHVGPTLGGRRFRQALVVVEVSLSLVLLLGATLLIRSFATLRSVDPGFRAADVLTLRVSLPTARYREPELVQRFFRDAVSRVSALPGVRSAGVVSFLPFAGSGAATKFTVAGRPAPPVGSSPVVEVRVCDAGYFVAMGIGLERGRVFNQREMQQRSDVVIVNRTLVREYFGGEDPIGQRLVINMGDPAVPTTIIGVVGDVRQHDLATGIRPMAYWPHPQLPYSAMTLTVRTAGEPLAVAPLVEREIRAIDPDQPVSDVRSMEQWIGLSLQRARFIWLLLANFAGLALGLTAVGLYGVMSYSVRQRTAEIGVRMALGAGERQIVGLVMRSGLGLTAVGLAAGAPLALLLARSLGLLLFAVTPTDPTSLAASTGLVGCAALAATYLPARRAARTNPVDVLRHQ